jgi:hypothetical protein
MNAPFQSETALVGLGLYTVPEASRITGVPGTTFRRWVFGYSRRRHGKRVDYAPLATPEIGKIDDQWIVGFRDLLEARVVNAFREAGVSWRVIRLSADNARASDVSTHPFLSKLFRTDGRTIFLESVKEAKEPELLDLAKNQRAFHNVIAPSLFKQIDFSANDEPLRWYPLWPRRTIVLDPKRSFGRPLAGSVPADTLAAVAKAENSADAAAKWYHVSRDNVDAALDWQKRLEA